MTVVAVVDVAAGGVVGEKDVGVRSMLSEIDVAGATAGSVGAMVGAESIG